MKLNALEAMMFARSAAERIRDSAENYLAMIEGSDRPIVQGGHFYRTFDGSIVFVFPERKRTRCDCPQCRGKQGILGMIFGTEIASQIVNAPPPENFDASSHSDDETPKEFLAVVLHGGHGIKGYGGCDPSDNYVIDPAGFAVMATEDSVREHDSTSRVMLAMAGLSLQKQIIPNFSDAVAKAARS